MSSMVIEYSDDQKYEDLSAHMGIDADTGTVDSLLAHLEVF